MGNTLYDPFTDQPSNYISNEECNPHMAVSIPEKYASIEFAVDDIDCIRFIFKETWTQEQLLAEVNRLLAWFTHNPRAKDRFRN